MQWSLKAISCIQTVKQQFVAVIGIGYYFNKLLRKLDIYYLQLTPPENILQYVYSQSSLGFIMTNRLKITSAELNVSMTVGQTVLAFSTICYEQWQNEPILNTPQVGNSK